MNEKYIVFKKIKINIDLVSKALHIPEEAVIKEFRDGRVTSRFSEYWAAELYNFKKNNNTNKAAYDGTIEHPLLGSFCIGVRSLTKSGIKFQQSKYIGSGRKCTQKDLLLSLTNIDFELIIDIIDFPIIYFIPVDGNILINLIKEKKLTPSGYNRQNFYKFIFNCPIEKLNIENVNLNHNNNSFKRSL